MTEFRYSPSKWVPFRDVAVLDRVRKIRRGDITKHANGDYRIEVQKDADVGFKFAVDMLQRIVRARDAGEKIVFILPNPNPRYLTLAHMINALRIDCSHVHAFAMDEYADEDGRIAPETWPQGFTYAMYQNFLYAIDEDLRPPKKQIVGFTNANLADYAKMIDDLGGADMCYSGPGWTGHLAFIEPDSPEFGTDDLEEFKAMGPRIVTLSPFTLAQNSLHGSFGMSGDLALVPPKAATIGPAQVIAAKHRRQTFALSIHGTTTTWQRLIARLVMHGPVTPRVPESICQTLRTDAVVSETVAMDIRPDWAKGY